MVGLVAPLLKRSYLVGRRSRLNGAQARPFERELPTVVRVCTAEETTNLEHSSRKGKGVHNGQYFFAPPTSARKREQQVLELHSSAPFIGQQPTTSTTINGLNTLAGFLSGTCMQIISQQSSVSAVCHSRYPGCIVGFTSAPRL